MALGTKQGKNDPKMAKKRELGPFFNFLLFLGANFSPFRAEGHFLLFFANFFPFSDFGPFSFCISGRLTRKETLKTAIVIL